MMLLNSSLKNRFTDRFFFIWFFIGFLKFIDITTVGFAEFLLSKNEEVGYRLKTFVS